MAELLRIAASANAKVTVYLHSRRGQLKNVPDAHFFGQCPLKFLLERRNFTAVPISCDLIICTTRYSRSSAMRSSSLLCMINGMNSGAGYCFIGYMLVTDRGRFG